MAPPVAVLWTDKEREWQTILPRLREAMPQVFTLGDFDLASRTGPGIWIRAVLARAMSEPQWPTDTVPVIYLPGVGRSDLRAIEACPAPLLPLAELQYRGVFWTQQSGRDWTLRAFLQSEQGGLGLDVAQDAATLAAVARALSRLADEPLAPLRVKRLEAEDFNALLHPDPARTLLQWLNDPKATRARWAPGEWAAFRSACRDKYAFDPEGDSELEAAEQLVKQKGSWKAVWTRFEEAPGAFPNVKSVLKRVQIDLFPSPALPLHNENQENALRAELIKLKNSKPHDARKRISELEARHGERRAWVWARLGDAPLACALVHLAVLAETASRPLGGTTPDQVAEQFAQEGWRADAAAIDALAAVQDQKDVQAVQAALTNLYAPWLEASALHLQHLVGEDPLPVNPGLEERAVGPLPSGSCFMFIDGLRFDIAMKLKQGLDAKGWSVDLKHCWSTMPSVTATGKYAVSPIAPLLDGNEPGDQFCPLIAATAQPLSHDRFQRLLSESGIQVLDRDATGDPAGCAWTEAGTIDDAGHREGWKLSRRIQEELAWIIQRVASLLNAGWREIRVATDHGWLLLPGGLPKVHLSKYVAKHRWGRCAVLETGADAIVQTVPWFWNKDAQIAIAPGISCFEAGMEYAHGGLSVQECVTPALRIRAGAAKMPVVSITSVTWKGLKCSVALDGDTQGCMIDLRSKAGDPSSSLTVERQPRPIAKEKMATLYADDAHQDAAAVLVVVSEDGRPLAKRATTVGGGA